MARLFLPASLAGKSLLAAACAVALLALPASSARAQTAPRSVPRAMPPRPANPVTRNAPAPRPFSPPVSRAPVTSPTPGRPLSAPVGRAPTPIFVRPRSARLATPFVFSPRLAAAAGGFLFSGHPIFFARRFLFGSPLFPSQAFDFGVGLGFTTWLSPNCSPYWAFGYYCTGLPPVSSPFANYFTLPPPEPTVYSYAPQGQPLVWLYLKNGTAYSVADYWFVNDQVHFLAVDANGATSPEQTIAFDDLDVPKTADINTRRGFRVVKRNQPLAQYLRDQPNSVPPLLQSSPDP